MTQCTFCNENVQDGGDAFCISCGTPIQTPSTPNNLSEKDKNENKIVSCMQKGRLVFPDSFTMEIDSSHRLIGRVNLGKFSKDPTLISRGQFTVYMENEQYYLEDGRTNVQDKPSVNHTILNGSDVVGKEKSLLNDGDIIQTSDVKILFKEGD